MSLPNLTEQHNKLNYYTNDDGIIKKAEQLTI